MMNLNLLGAREPGVYGTMTLDEISNQVTQLARELNVQVDFFQSNHEGDIVEKIGQARNAYAALIINPAAYTHTSVAIRDAIAAAGIAAIEIHLSNIYGREEFRHKSLIAPVCKGQISGFGPESYLLALRAAATIEK
jgi:3-dehydroquinate dehydratase-2